MARRHNNANILCISANDTTPEEAIKIVDAFIKTNFEAGGRHERRVGKLEIASVPRQTTGTRTVEQVDHSIAEFIRQECKRQFSARGYSMRLAL